MKKKLESSKTVRGQSDGAAKRDARVECQDGKKLILRGRGNGSQAGSGKKQKRMEAAPLHEEAEMLSIPKIVASLEKLGIDDKDAIKLVDLIINIPREKRVAAWEVIISQINEDIADASRAKVKKSHTRIPGCSRRNPTPTVEEYAQNGRRAEGKRSVNLGSLNPGHDGVQED